MQFTILASLLPHFLDPQCVFILSWVLRLEHSHQFPCRLVHLWQFPIVYFKNGSEYLTRGMPRCLFFWWAFRLQSLVTWSFLLLLRTTFVIFPFISVWWHPLFQYNFLRVFLRSIYGWFFFEVSDSKSPQFSKTLLNILADFNTAVVWMVSILPLISNPSTFIFQIFGDYSKHTNYNW